MSNLARHVSATGPIPDGVAALAGDARAAGATEAEITEAVEAGYLYGGTAAFLMGINAFTS